jgi:hypothetical protein
MNGTHQKRVWRKAFAVLPYLMALGFVSLAIANTTPQTPLPIIAQGDENNPNEFTLTAFSDAARGWSFMRPASWSQDSDFKEGVRFVGGNEWLELRVINSGLSVQEYSNQFGIPKTETKIGSKAYKQGKFNAQVISSKTTGKSSVTGKILDLLVDRWVFSPATGKLAMLTVTGPTKVFDWEGNRDMAISVRVK